VVKSCQHDPNILQIKVPNELFKNGVIGGLFVA